MRQTRARLKLVRTMRWSWMPIALTLTVTVTLGAMVACGDATRDRVSAESGRVAEAKQRIGAVTDHAAGVLAGRATAADSALVMLTASAGGDGSVYRPTRDTAQLHSGTIVGRVSSPKAIVGDVAVDPTHDLSVCKPFTETQVPSEKNGIGNAIVWLIGVETGPVDDSPRRVSLTLDRCRLEPRVQRVPLGSTLMVRSRDGMMSRLTFTDLARAGADVATVTLNDVGQVVPTAVVTAHAGLVEVRDALHPWVRAYLAVAPHPFVLVTDADGEFRFDGVPAGSYTMVIWQEKTGVRTRVVRVTAGVETRVAVEY